MRVYINEAETSALKIIRDKLRHELEHERDPETYASKQNLLTLVDSVILKLERALAVQRWGI